MDRLIDLWIDGCIDGCIDVLMYGSIDRWIDLWINKWIDGGIKYTQKTIDHRRLWMEQSYEELVKFIIGPKVQVIGPFCFFMSKYIFRICLVIWYDVLSDYLVENDCSKVSL